MLQLSSGQDAFYYQLFVEKDERLSFPTVQQLFEQSFLASDIKLKEVPSCLIIQMPRFGKNFKMYPRILPSQVLDVTDIIETCESNSRRFNRARIESNCIDCPLQPLDSVVFAANWPNWSARNAMVRCNLVPAWKVQASVDCAWTRCICMTNAPTIHLVI